MGRNWIYSAMILWSISPQRSILGKPLHFAKAPATLLVEAKNDGAHEVDQRPSEEYKYLVNLFRSGDWPSAPPYPDKLIASAKHVRNEIAEISAGEFKGKDVKIVPVPLSYDEKGRPKEIILAAVAPDRREFTFDGKAIRITVRRPSELGYPSKIALVIDDKGQGSTVINGKKFTVAREYLTLNEEAAYVLTSSDGKKLYRLFRWGPKPFKFYLDSYQNEADKRTWIDVEQKSP